MSSASKDPVRITTYTAPKGRTARGIIISAIIMLLSARKEVISPGSPIYDYLLAGNPTATRYATLIQNGIFYFLFGAHGIEVPLFAWLRLRKHGVPFASLAWFQWVATVFAGGMFCWEHFDRQVKKAGASR